MDKFEQEYFEKVTKLAADFKERRRELAKGRIKMFVAALTRQIIELHEKFDILLGSGNSGLFMTTIAKMTYENLRIKSPLILNFPIYRFKDDNITISDNSPLLLQAKEALKNISVIRNVLFVDDEIMRAITANECFNLILKAYPDINHINATIIAENHFFEWHYKIPKVSITFFAYARLIQGLNGNIGHFIPEDLYKKASSCINDIQSYNHCMAVIIGGGLKRKDNKNAPSFDFNIESTLKHGIADYDKKKQLLFDELQNLVKEGIEEYKKGKIKFRF